jgi:RNA polymerase sigma-70 factor, ECF subfamily
MSSRSNPPTPLHDLIARCGLRDRAAFVALYQATSANLFGVALRILKRRPWAEEVLQEAYLKIWNHAPSYQAHRGAPMTWMINVVRNQALDLKRRADVRAEIDAVPVDEDMPGELETPGEAAATNADLARLRGCLGRLAEAQRQCLLLVYHQGHTPAEVARLQSLPLGTVKTWVRRGLARVRECMHA